MPVVETILPFLFPTQHGYMYVQWKFENETKLSISMSWIGKRNTGESSAMLLWPQQSLCFCLASRQKLYKSDDFGKTFKRINAEIFNTHIRKDSGIMKSPVNPKKVCSISDSCVPQYSIFPSTSGIVMTEDGGESWRKIKVPFQISGPLLFHPHEENWILARAVVNGMAYLSKDFGVTWTFLQSYVRSLKWGARTDEKVEKEEKTILMTVSTDAHHFLMGDANLIRSRDLGEHFKSIHVQHVYSFGLQGQFLFVSVDHNKNNNTRIMHVSKNGGDSWDPVQVPTVTPERFYSILDMSEGLIFLHVDDPGDTGRGVLYTSDADGIVFSESLRNHVYTNFLEVNDFYKVESMRGTYLTSRMNDDNSVSTLISYDRGGEWKTIPLTKEQCNGAKLEQNEKCSLQIHNRFSRSRMVDVPMGPLSVPNAVGIIIAHGNPGTALSRHIDVWMTRNGGYTWYKVLTGPHHYSIGDHGSLIVAVPAHSESTTNYLMYSVNEGRCWFKYRFTEHEFHVTGLVTEPGAKTMRFSLWGSTLPSREWEVITVDFEKVLTRACKDGVDYEKWVPHGEGANSGCLLGKKVSLQRPKKEELCFNGVDYIQKQTAECCKCTQADMECDYGYYRRPDTPKCLRDKRKPPDLCIHGDTEKLKDKLGYRLVPGDVCCGGDPVVKGYLDTHQICKNASWYEYGMDYKKAHTAKKGHSRVVVFLVVPMLLIVIAAAAYFGKKYWDLGKFRPTYRYSQLSQEDEEDLEGLETKYNPRPKGLRAYRDYDTSDDDAAMIDL
ncbi:Sortilin [Desmophyllum pertusum]|uniref:Sortilin n=1 Tax=Desmophyllum pertusum TaxID=174260 RepID=A0A9W9ZZH9_9CNID|nr:Sortilin [Desmophyllum pertusum]